MKQRVVQQASLLRGPWHAWDEATQDQDILWMLLDGGIPLLPSCCGASRRCGG